MNISRITADEIRCLSLEEKISIVEKILDSTVRDIEYSELSCSLYAKLKRRISLRGEKADDYSASDRREKERIAAIEMIGRSGYKNLFESLDGEDFENC